MSTEVILINLQTMAMVGTLVTALETTAMTILVLIINEDMFNTLWNTVCGFADKQSDIFWEGNLSHQLAIIKDILRGGVGLQDSEISTISQEMNVMVQDFWKKIRRKAFIPTRNDEIV